MSAPVVRAAVAGERDVVARTLAVAFDSDPVMRWLRPHGSIEPLCRVLARRDHAVPGMSDLCSVDGEIVGAALWDPPGWQAPLAQYVLHVPDYLRALGPAGLRRATRLANLAARARPRGRHLYLGLVGATLTGRGVGSALLRQRLEGWAGSAYLESSNAANLPLYARFGFEVVRELRLPEDGPPIWAMLRPAR